jgi:hypothetical protein
MAGDTVFRNPASSHGDRELPEICANGTGVSVVGLSDSGTSFAAPIEPTSWFRRRASGY